MLIVVSPVILFSPMRSSVNIVWVVTRGWNLAKGHLTCKYFCHAALMFLFKLYECVCIAVRWRGWMITQWSELGVFHGSPQTRTSPGSSGVSTSPSMQTIHIHFWFNQLSFFRVCTIAICLIIDCVCVEEVLHCVWMLRAGEMEKH